MKPRGTDADSPADVVQALQLARKSGLLVIERRINNGSIEQGTITLTSGQITDASLGVYRGNTALDLLMRWGNCNFVLYPPSANSASASHQQPSGEINAPMSNNGAKSYPAPVAPYRLAQIDAALPHFPRLGLTRAHRQVFLLVDGQRTIAELSRLTGRGTEDVHGLLSDLARVGLIHL